MKTANKEPAPKRMHRRAVLQPRKVAPVVLLVALVAGGVLALLYFWSQLLKPDELGLASLPLVAFIAAVASTFNPCGLPALPGFLAFMGVNSEGAGVKRRAGLSLAAGLGAMSLVVLLGILVAIVGSGTKGLIAPQFRWVQLAVGVFLIGMATLHLMGRTERLPLLGPVTNLGSRMWQGAMGNPTPRGSYLFGAGFVLVGVG